MKNPHLVKIQDDAKCTAFILNPAAYTPKIILGKSQMPAGVVLAATANYHNGKGVPIGFCFDSKTVHASVRTEKDEYRTHLICGKDGMWGFAGPCWVDATDTCVIQIGPRLVALSEVDIRSKEELFRDDAIRRADHIGYGITPAGKLIVAYFKSASLEEMADQFVEWKCVSAAKADGGSCAFLAAEGQVWKNEKLKGLPPVLLAFVPRGKK